jgi:hypothetical protein
MSTSSFALFRSLAVAALAGSLSGPALAQDAESQSEAPKSPAEIAAGLVGIWEFSNADHDKICRFNLRGETATGGYKLDIDKNCPALFPSTKDIVGWGVDSYGSMRLLDIKGNPLIELTEAESGIYDGFEPGQGRYVLQSAPAAPVRSVEDMLGDWAVARGSGKPICLLTFANSAGTADALALKVKPGCDALVTRFNPTSWRMDQGDVVLLSAAGKSWRFEENDANTWQRVPEGADPVLLLRQ